jgi:hypothetical protein
MAHRSISGEMLYTSKKPEMLNQQRGYEWFRYTHHGDGKMTLRAHCEIWDPAPTVLRDIVYSLDERRKPMDCHVRLTVGDQFMGSGWFRFTDTMIECESYGPSIGRLSQRVPLDKPVEVFGTHPVVADGYMLSLYDWSNTKEQPMNAFVTSPDHRGATPPQVGRASLMLRYLGDETVTVKAGVFNTRHFQFFDPHGGMGDHPAYDVWITNDEDAIMVQGGVGGYMQTWYELAKLDR